MWRRVRERRPSAIVLLVVWSSESVSVLVSHSLVSNGSVPLDPCWVRGYTTSHRCAELSTWTGHEMGMRQEGIPFLRMVAV